MNPSTPYQAFKRTIKQYNAQDITEADKLPNIPLHGLRLTSATLLIAEHVDPRTVSTRLGHSKTSTTLDIYSHSLRSTDERAAEALNNLFKNSKAN